MADGPLDPPPPAATSPAFLRPRREAFEHGLLPIPKLIFPEGTLAQTLAQLKEKLAPAAVAGGGRVGAAALLQALQIPTKQATLALGTLAAVLPAEDPALGARPPRRAALPLHPVVQAPRAARSQGLAGRRRRLALHLRVRWLPVRALPDPAKTLDV